jgi:hypothetical protein
MAHLAHTKPELDRNRAQQGKNKKIGEHVRKSEAMSPFPERVAVREDRSVCRVSSKENSPKLWHKTTTLSRQIPCNYMMRDAASRTWCGWIWR